VTEFDIDTDKMATDRNVLDDVNRKVIEEFRANGGKVGGPFADSDVVLLTNIGAKSGKPRVSPLVYFDIDGRVLIAGSFGGAPKAPAWVHNLRAHPRVSWEIGTESFEGEARELPLDERNALYPRVVEMAPQFGEYQAKTTRIIPLFELIPD
jgi:deazaflavin-dependent oxidoreductase (nitroreductase family)